MSSERRSYSDTGYESSYDSALWKRAGLTAVSGLATAAAYEAGNYAAVAGFGSGTVLGAIYTLDSGREIAENFDGIEDFLSGDEEK